MKETENSLPQEHGLSPAAIDLYQWVVRRGRMRSSQIGEAAQDLSLDVADVESGLRDLERLHLLRPAPGQASVLVPSSPEAAIAGLVTPIEMKIMEWEKRTEGLKSQLLALNPAYFESRQARNGREAIDVLTDADEVRAVLTRAGRKCSAEVFSAHPGSFSGEAIGNSLPHDVELLACGVKVRSLYQHPVRVNPVMRDFLARRTEAGCEVRTCGEIPDSIVIFDREVAFIPGGSEPGGALLLREPSVVGFLHRGLELLWSSAAPFVPDARVDPGYGVARGGLKRTILRLLASGAKDELIARRLSMSLRTCRRHVAEIMEELQATSRFQAGVLAARGGLLERRTPEERDEAAFWESEATA
ncbi:LuxR C-terminal-related transcriptional regulator [Streptosporangium fragile]|uniref:LuxR C-terminal-related transcriptional regulator n=1 Tax=Streptosporangium fragile TaxID=46186 RepID=A0ABN3W569_9ACTN